MRKLSYFTLAGLFLTAILTFTPAQAVDEINLGYFSDVALDGYDAVDYFASSRPVKGKKSFSYQWKEATWLFSSEENLQRFIASPEQYAPQYGGYCSNQMSLGNLSDIDPEVWKIIDNKLYLFGHNQGRVRWKSKTSERIEDANGHWKRFLHP